METLKRFDVVEHDNLAMVVIESDLLPPDPAVVVIPLLPDYPVVNLLNPEIVIGERELILATRLITAVRRNAVRKIGNVAAKGDEITRAVDILMAGV